MKRMIFFVFFFRSLFLRFVLNIRHLMQTLKQTTKILPITQQQKKNRQKNIINIHTDSRLYRVSLDAEEMSRGSVHAH